MPNIVDLPPASIDADWPTLKVLRQRYIERALQRVGGNKTHAADLLGIQRKTLARMLTDNKKETP